MYNYCFGRSEKLNSILYSGVLKQISIRLSISYMFRHICSSSSLIWSLQFSQDILHGLQVKVSTGPQCPALNARPVLHFRRYAISARHHLAPGDNPHYKPRPAAQPAPIHLAYGGNGQHHSLIEWRNLQTKASWKIWGSYTVYLDFF